MDWKLNIMRDVLLFLLSLIIVPMAWPATFPVPADGSTVVGEVKAVLPSSGNTLLDIARHFDVGYEEIVAANPGISVWTPGEEVRVMVPSQFILPPRPWQGIVINIPQRRLYFFPASRKGQAPKVITYPISIAREGWSTPLGYTRIVGKYRNPSWFVPGSIKAEHLLEEGIELPEYFPPGPDNPMGMLALRTGFPGIFIHATNRPWGVGMRTSHGCIHLYPEDAAELFPLVQVGTPVRVINEPFPRGNDRGRLVMASFEPVAEYPRAAPIEDNVFEALQEYPPTDRVGGGFSVINWSRVQQLSSVPQPIPVALTNDQPGLAAQLDALVPILYDLPPYGVDANNASNPGKRHSELLR